MMALTEKERAQFERGRRDKFKDQIDEELREESPFYSEGIVSASLEILTGGKWE